MSHLTGGRPQVAPGEQTSGLRGATSRCTLKRIKRNTLAARGASETSIGISQSSMIRDRPLGGS